MKRFFHNLIIAAFLMCTITSCYITGWWIKTDYKLLSDKEKELIAHPRVPIDSLPYDGHVALVTTDQLKETITQHDSVLVYMWRPYCKSENCSSPSMVEYYCDKHGYKPYIVLDQYTDWLHYYDGKSPLLMIDPAQWNTNKMSEYLDNIWMEFTGKDMEANDYNIYLLFHQGQFVRTLKRL